MVRWNTASVSSGSYDHGVVGQIPESRYYPPVDLQMVCSGNDGDSGARRAIIVSKTGVVTWSNLGGTQQMNGATAFLSW